MAAEDFEDDPEIGDDWTVWRRIPPYHVVADGQGGHRPSSAAFEDDPRGGPMSVIIVEKGADKARALAGHDGFTLVAIRVGLLRQLGQKVVHDPLNEEPAHGLVVGEKHKKRFCKAVAVAATWV
ncbi:MAG: hypothetical protein IPG45_30165 [Deltaproteobacteria bacterium]|nr:hypothetical protein [Deltaproteobacteria bacterium]